MHRAFGRVFRGTCRKWRENEVPAVGGEEVRRNQDKKEKFVPPTGHTSNELLGWTTGLVVAYTAHRRQSVFSHGCASPATATTSSGSSETTQLFKGCPFNNAIASATKKVSQPLFSSSYSTAACVNSSKCQPKTALLKRDSIDTSPFLTENLLLSETESETGSRNQSINFEDEDDNISFSDSLLEDKSILQQTAQSKPSVKENKKSSVVYTTKQNPEKHGDPAVVSWGERVSGDVLSVLGAFQFLRGKKSLPTTDPPLTAIQLMEQGAAWGSSRALYNMGVFYDRQKDFDLAKEYYKKASDLGHPLAAYNCAVFTLHDGSIVEGLSLMQFAAKNGVQEAIDFVKDL